ncbi:uncharacterized protein LOC103309781 [Acyrthosiphon pisum]|uniref:Uncharacterized protein n=1 Tax=Acyrthosiphon pisum TaxID=7029 RepID=A0A8R2D522_ACYPI|nr:uncharacterized protein LOC103309781 [Acyrthosiphon pisum]|eukprot:XP_016660929.1 PREDICTED: uncharacterized protein LOC103309781 [Acyrthosiphon pisum]
MENEIRYEIPSLLKTAYYACNEVERDRYDSLEAPDVDMRHCCELLFKILTIDKNRNEDNERQTMFSRSKLNKYNRDMYKNILCAEAASSGHIDCMKLAHEIGVPWDTMSRANDNACDQAAKSGYLECLRYAWENGCPWDVDTCTSASMNGHMDCLVYAWENGCPWDVDTCTSAAMNGHMDCLVYAQENRCPWDVDTCTSAAIFTYK